MRMDIFQKDLRHFRKIKLHLTVIIGTEAANESASLLVKHIVRAIIFAGVMILQNLREVVKIFFAKVSTSNKKECIMDMYSLFAERLTKLMTEAQLISIVIEKKCTCPRVNSSAFPFLSSRYTFTKRKS